MPTRLPPTLALPLVAVLVAPTPACAGARKRAAAPTADLSSQLPILPAEVGEVYGRGRATPADPIVAVTAAALPWDEALSGGAGALALQVGGELSLAQAQWAAWRAGYPHPVVAGAVEATDALGAPASVARLLADGPQPGDDLGLARARVGEQDRWVALVGRPVPDVPTFARQHEVGEVLRVALPAEARWVLVSPEGVPLNGGGPVEATLDRAGEWWLDATLPAGRLSVPLYAGMEMPAEPVVALPGDRAASPEDARAALYRLVGEVRAEFELGPLQVDPMLETLAQAPLQAVLDGAWDRDAEVQRLRAAGFVAGAADQVWCAAPTPALCVESLLRTASGRVALLDPGHTLAGAQVQLTTEGVHAVLDLAAGE